jgi:chromate transporter
MAVTDGGESRAAGHDPKSSADLGHVPSRVSLRDIALAFAKIGTIGFGGGLGMLALLRNEVVEKRRWLDDQQLGVAVALGQMLPGPFISNYSYYIGHELRGVKGMAVAVGALLLPCMVLMVILSALYFRYGDVPVVTKLFSGVQPVVVGILAWATWSIGRANIRDRKAVLIGAIAAVALLLKADVLLVVLGCGILGIFLSGAWRRVKWDGTAALAPVGFWLGSAAAFAFPAVVQLAGELAFLFLKIGATTFGGGFAAIPFIQHEVVELRGWLTAKEFIDGVALGQLTPGPVAITATFIGYKVLGLPGALIATLGVFLPSGLMLLGLIHVYRRVSSNVFVRGFLTGVMPAVAGMLLSATLFLGRSAIAGPTQAVLAVLTLCLLLRFKVEPVWLILGGAVVGLVAV